jgi:hypothetical protein
MGIATVRPRFGAHTLSHVESISDVQRPNFFLTPVAGGGVDERMEECSVGGSGLWVWND